MKNGYYISTFLVVDELQHTYGIKTRHDQAIALWEKQSTEVKLIRYWELERISGIKMHPNAFKDVTHFELVLEMLLNSVGLKKKDIVAIWGTKPIETDTSYYHYNDNLAFHSIAHIFSSLFFGVKKLDSTTKILALSVDAGPDSGFETDAYDKNYYAGMIIDGKNIEVFPIFSPGKLWSTCHKIFGLREGSLMALATACSCEICVDITKYDLKFDNKNVRKKAYEIVKDIRNIIENSLKTSQALIDNRFSLEENVISAVMKNIQRLSRKIMDDNVEFIIKKYSLDPHSMDLALSGGFSLNCPTNSYLLKKYGFRNLIVPPCISDCGIALGVGIGGFWNDIINGLEVSIESAYLGESDYSCYGVFEKYHNNITSISKYNAEIASHDIEENKIVIWFDSNAEIGPRALGHRSIIGDPRYSETKNLLNVIKKREWWRPVAPIVLDEFGKNYFEDYSYSPFMLLNFNLKESYKNKLPAIQHLDGTCRIQSLKREDNESLFELLTKFYDLTGTPILCNTSLNDNGEPIINTIEEAFRFAIKKKIKVLYLNAFYRIELQFSNEKSLTTDLEHSLSRNKLLFNNFNEIADPAQDFDLSKEEMTYYCDNPLLFPEYLLDQEEGKNFIRKQTASYLNEVPISLKR